MADLIVTGILLVTVGASVIYMVRAKKRGVKCIGCPSGCKCSGKGDGQSALGCPSDTKEPGQTK
ncbi:MAG: FeoB-associated Cys-rich membrane protein [Kineothrix sp.]